MACCKVLSLGQPCLSYTSVQHSGYYILKYFLADVAIVFLADDALVIRKSHNTFSGGFGNGRNFLSWMVRGKPVDFFCDKCQMLTFGSLKSLNKREYALHCGILLNVVVVVVEVNFRKGGISPGRVFKISSTDFYTFDSRNTIARCRRLKMRTSSPQIPTWV